MELKIWIKQREYYDFFNGYADSILEILKGKNLRNF